MKLTLISFLLTTLFYFSGPTAGIHYFIPKSQANFDSTLITIPFNVKFSQVSEAYVNEKKPKIDSFYNKFINSPYYSGSFLVAKNGRIIYEDYKGFSNAKTGKKIDANTAIHLASVSKVLTATAILKLVQEDNLMLDQKVTDWIPKFPYKKTTIRTLLNHRSGLPHYSNFPGIMKKAWNRKKVLTNRDILDLMIKQKFKPVFADNTRFDYCNTNYIILALIIERATGQNYRDAMQTLIFKPLGMNNTFVFNYETDKDTVCKSYRASTIFPWDQYDNLYGDKNIYATPRDLVKFDLATYSSDFIKPELLQEAYYGYSATHVAKPIKDYGLGMRMRFLPPNGEKMVYHNGWWHGNNTSFVPVKKDTVTVICLGNRYSNRPYATLSMVSSLFYKKKTEIETPVPTELEMGE
ncbi:beta-lactamase family protein [Flavobacterium sp. J49]|uniref:serine hydrolase domain-containing protein n=1 Tax=Flavobacterium sp. J49 TaxID=2718534 RepID=UPI001592BA1F|nr:serine hydrolase domain-containing protein [Flavobacterium sp. J49]MBF6642473.1 beta-lactamase family protein [Flavobacterium sp. J49]NIC03719.1 beta-lactamase family protein [Flavobacterium sp. J49]